MKFMIGFIIGAAVMLAALSPRFATVFSDTVCVTQGWRSHCWAAR